MGPATGAEKSSGRHGDGAGKDEGADDISISPLTEHSLPTGTRDVSGAAAHAFNRSDSVTVTGPHADVHTQSPSPSDPDETAHQSSLLSPYRICTNASCSA